MRTLRMRRVDPRLDEAIAEKVERSRRRVGSGVNSMALRTRR